MEDVPSGFAGLPAMDAVVKEVSTPTIRVEGVEIGPGVRINNRASSDEAAEGDNQSATVADADDEDEDEGEEGEEEEELAEWEVHERKRRAAQERRKAAGINDEDLYDDYDEFIRVRFTFFSRGGTKSELAWWAGMLIFASWCDLLLLWRRSWRRRALMPASCFGSGSSSRSSSARPSPTSLMSGTT